MKLQKIYLKIYHNSILEKINLIIRIIYYLLKKMTKNINYNKKIRKFINKNKKIVNKKKIQLCLSFFV